MELNADEDSNDVELVEGSVFEEFISVETECEHERPVDPRKYWFNRGYDDSDKHYYVCQKCRKEICEESIMNLRLSVLPSGFDYSKDKVQTSPTDQMPEYAAELDEMITMLERKRRELTEVMMEIDKI